jgi:hypothetical protein
MTLLQGVVPAKTTCESLEEFARSGALLQPNIVIRQATITKFIENNYYSKLMRNKRECENLHMTLYFLDEA